MGRKDGRWTRRGFVRTAALGGLVAGSGCTPAQQASEPAPAAEQAPSVATEEAPAEAQQPTAEAPPPPATGEEASPEPSATAAPSASSSAEKESAPAPRRWRPKTDDDDIFKDRY